MNVVAVIPAFNEEVMLPKVVEETKKHCNEIVIVDDCSTDKTPEACRDLGVHFVRNEKNLGQGGSTRKGVEVAMLLGADIIVTLDGDGQHDASQIPQLLKTLSDNPAIDVVMGSRFLPGSGNHVPRYRKVGINLITWAINLGSEHKVSDSLLCFRAFRRVVFRHVTIEEDGFGFCPEVLIKIREKGFRIREIPVHCVYHNTYSLNSTFNPLRLAAILVWKTIVWRLRVEHGVETWQLPDHRWFRIPR